MILTATTRLISTDSSATSWVGHTRAWTIPGTEDLKPYIPRKTLVAKWLIVLVGNPILSAALAGIMLLVLKGNGMP